MKFQYKTSVSHKKGKNMHQKNRIGSIRAYLIAVTTLSNNAFDTKDKNLCKIPRKSPKDWKTFRFMNSCLMMLLHISHACAESSGDILPGNESEGAVVFVLWVGESFLQTPCKI